MIWFARPGANSISNAVSAAALALSWSIASRSVPVPESPTLLTVKVCAQADEAMKHKPAIKRVTKRFFIGVSFFYRGQTANKNWNRLSQASRHNVRKFLKIGHNVLIFGNLS